MLTFVTKGSIGLVLDLATGKLEGFHSSLGELAPGLDTGMVLAELQGARIRYDRCTTDGDANDDGHDGYSSGEDSSGTEGGESLVFDADASKGDREVTDAVENILPELPGTMGLPERELGRIQGVGIGSEGGE